jgi:hypothetical protein
LVSGLDKETSCISSLLIVLIISFSSVETFFNVHGKQTQISIHTQTVSSWHKYMHRMLHLLWQIDICRCKSDADGNLGSRGSMSVLNFVTFADTETRWFATKFCLSFWLAGIFVRLCRCHSLQQSSVIFCKVHEVRWCCWWLCADSDLLYPMPLHETRWDTAVAAHLTLAVMCWWCRCHKWCMRLGGTWQLLLTSCWQWFADGADVKDHAKTRWYVAVAADFMLAVICWWCRCHRSC